MSFVVYPAIDLINGKCVRLYQGDYAKETIYGDDPISQALNFESDGAEWIHLGDLDAARTGSLENTSVIKNICEETKKINGNISKINEGEFKKEI